MRVLYLSHRRDYSGGEIVLERLIIHDPTVDSIVVLPEGAFAERLRQQGIRVLIENRLLPLSRQSRKLWFPRLLNFPRILKNLLSVIQQENVDIIVANGIGAVPYAALAGFLSNQKAIWIHHHPELKPKTIEFYVAPIFGQMTAKIIAVSNAVRHSLLQAGISGDKIVTIYNGIDIDNVFNPDIYETGYLRRRYSISQRTILVGLIGAINWEKGFHVAVQAVKTLKEKGLGQKEFICFFIGGVSDESTQDLRYKEELEREIQANRLESQILFTGKIITNIAPVYKDLDIVLNCSIKQESLGTTIYEGLVMEKLVIATNIGGSAEIIDNSINGLLVHPNDPLALANILRDAIANYDSYEHIRKQAREKAKGKFSIEKMVSQYNEIYQGIIEKHVNKGR